MSAELNLTETDTIKLEYHSANLGEEAEFTLAEESLEDVDKGHTPGGLLDLESNSNDFAPRKKVCDFRFFFHFHEIIFDLHLRLGNLKLMTFSSDRYSCSYL